MNWQQKWIDGVLAEIPAGSYRRRMEAELRDHLESQCRALAEAGWTPDQAQAETLRTMGEPEALRKEYKAAWRRSWLMRGKERFRRLIAWAGGCALMGGVHLLVSYVLSTMWRMAISLPGNSQDKWVRLIRGTVGDLNNSYLIWWLPLVVALVAGAFYLGRKLQASPLLVSAGLCVHWACIAAFNGWWRAMDDHHRPFWEAVGNHFLNAALHYVWTFALCILLGVFFGHLGEKTSRRAAE